jgi:hypothetical protein
VSRERLTLSVINLHLATFPGCALSCRVSGSYLSSIFKYFRVALCLHLSR